MSECREIPLSNGGVALVDAEDFDFISRWKWKRHTGGYACRSGWDSTRKKWITILMHRLLVEIPDGCEVDHINRVKLDNRRSNLRAVRHALNNHNQGPWVRNTSGQRGVVWDKNRGKWLSRLTLDGKTHHLGRFDQFEDAAAAYEEARKELIDAA